MPPTGACSKHHTEFAADVTGLSERSLGLADRWNDLGLRRAAVRPLRQWTLARHLSDSG
jgi:hypothetical protein